MAKSKKRHGKKSLSKSEGKRPWELITLLVVLGISTLFTAYQWFFFTANNIVGGNSLPVAVGYLPLYRNLLLLIVFLQILMCVLLFLGLKAGFWGAAVLLSLNFVSQLLSLDIVGILFHALYIYLLFCEATRAYFRIGKYHAQAPKHK